MTNWTIRPKSVGSCASSGEVGTSSRKPGAFAKVCSPRGEIKLGLAARCSIGLGLCLAAWFRTASFGDDVSVIGVRCDFAGSLFFALFKVPRFYGAPFLIRFFNCRWARFFASLHVLKCRDRSLFHLQKRCAVLGHDLIEQSRFLPHCVT